MARHLHHEAGGDPSQGPVREVANQTPSPGADNDFPDVPAANRPPDGATAGDGDAGDADTGDADTGDADSGDTEDGDTGD